MRLVPKNANMTNLDMKSLRLTMILGDRFNTTSIKENASSKGDERSGLLKFQSVKIDHKSEDNPLEKYDQYENIVINTEHEEETPLTQSNVENIKRRDSFKASLTDFDPIPKNHLTLLSTNYQRSSILKKSKTMESVEFD